MVGCMTSCTCASSILSVSSSNWATPQTPNKPQSSQNSTPCKSVSNLSEELSICTSLSGKLSIYTSMSGKLNTYTFVSFIFVEHQFFLISLLSQSMRYQMLMKAKYLTTIINWLFLCPDIKLSSKLRFTKSTKNWCPWIVMMNTVVLNLYANYQ